MSNPLLLLIAAALFIAGAVSLIVFDHGNGIYSGYIATFLGFLSLLVTNIVQISNQKAIHQDIKEIKTNVTND